MMSRLRTVRSMPCATLLAVQLLGVVLYPFMEGGEVGKALLSLFGLVVLALAVVAVRSTPALTWVSLTIGLPVVILTVVEAAQPGNQSVALWSGVFHALFYFYTTYGLIAYMFADTWVTPDELFATGAAFTVAAWGFAYVYSVTQIIWPGSFVAALNSGAPRTWFELLFLSFTTMTSVGLSDITPVLPNARSFVMIEQVSGVMYVALVVARLVGLTIARFRR